MCSGQRIGHLNLLRHESPASGMETSCRSASTRSWLIWTKSPVVKLVDFSSDCRRWLGWVSGPVCIYYSTLCPVALTKDHRVPMRIPVCVTAQFHLCLDLYRLLAWVSKYLWPIQLTGSVCTACWWFEPVDWNECRTLQTRYIIQYKPQWI